MQSRPKKLLDLARDAVRWMTDYLLERRDALFCSALYQTKTVLFVKDVRESLDCALFAPNTPFH